MGRGGVAEERIFSCSSQGFSSAQRGEVLSRLEAKGFRIIGLKMMRVSRQLAETHYREHRDKAFFGELVDYICSAPLIALVLEADGAVAMLRHLCGATKADQAAPGTIRGDFALHTNFNIIHASDSHESAEREIGAVPSDPRRFSIGGLPTMDGSENLPVWDLNSVFPDFGSEKYLAAKSRAAGLSAETLESTVRARTLPRRGCGRSGSKRPWPLNDELGSLWKPFRPIPTPGSAPPPGIPGLWPSSTPSRP